MASLWKGPVSMLGYLWAPERSPVYAEVLFQIGSIGLRAISSGVVG
jgi:hypothetical protein